MRLIEAHDEMQPGDIDRMTPVFTAVQSSISGVNERPTGTVYTNVMTYLLTFLVY